MSLFYEFTEVVLSQNSQHQHYRRHYGGFYNNTSGRISSISSFVSPTRRWTSCSTICFRHCERHKLCTFNMGTSWCRSIQGAARLRKITVRCKSRASGPQRTIRCWKTRTSTGFTLRPQRLEPQTLQRLSSAVQQRIRILGARMREVMR
jgi:hypothetical protein